MDLLELTSYAEKKYNMQEQRKWSDFPGFSVLCHPQTGKWVALLMRQCDSETGEEMQRCDMKCGREWLFKLKRPYLALPVRMHGDKWIDIAFNSKTERSVVFQLLDQSVALEKKKQYGYTIVLPSQKPTVEYKYQDTALPARRTSPSPGTESIPERIKEMYRLYEHDGDPYQNRARNFYRQAMFMQDYEDDYPWTYDFERYFPTYHDLTTQQLRGYFAWRTQLRKGIYKPIALSLAYMYIYELLNGAGVSSPEDCLEKLKQFEINFIDSGLLDRGMRKNLRCWTLEYAILHNLPREVALQAADPDLLEYDKAISVLQSAEEHTDEEVFGALCYFGGKKMENTPVTAKDREKGIHLFSEVWRAAMAYRQQEIDLFTLCFGTKQKRYWYPLSNMIYYKRIRPKNRDYVLDDCRHYYCRNEIWFSESFEKLTYDRVRMQGFLHETDAKLRRYLKTGRYLKEKAEDVWVVPYINAVIEADRQAEIEAAKPKITIDLSGLEQIRKDALVTQESLLVEDEAEKYRIVGSEENEIGRHEENKAVGRGLNETESRKGDAIEDRKKEKTERREGDKTERREEVKLENREKHETEISERYQIEASDEETVTASEDRTSSLPLDAVQMQVLRALLEGRDPAAIIRENHLMPSIVADSINEALFDEIGDTVVLCEDDKLFPVEDYIEDLIQLLGTADNT